ncbi:hypothetical protein BMS3Abin07_00619 [bacterium BMS3Abin07]|nr:hypothetical protein BMS3Abin07_00619 [bacterium BMS3Abin07]GBE31286.1 hypothetical protein BMS3Bbin05_00185 [bacterium BMS3Bbin05]HDL20650.1 hypothetical protein [Nitrospirota bacterium]HDO21335.1 hypothetical protein [Nitrospirota bacterium]HDZ87404.1 hypothetical protein [Nitrospirota bacterium]
MIIMHIVAIHKVPADAGDSTGLLAEAVGISAYEAGARLRVAGRFPVIIASFAELGEAEKTAAKINSAGFRAIVLKEDELESEAGRITVRKFSFEERGLVIESGHAKRLAVDYTSVNLILRGMSMKQTRETRTEKERKFSMGNALLSGGLVMTSSSEKEYIDVSENREGFIHIYDKENNIVVFRENSLNYSSLGERLKPSRSANFAFIISELKRLCAGALYDETLLNKGGQTQILGPLFNPEEHLDIAISLIAKSIRQE